MSKISDYVHSADWKTEKHVPAIELPASINAGEMFNVQVTVGKELPHPNTTEHHIVWIALHFIPNGGKFSIEIGRQELSAHGQSAEGPNKGPAYTDSASLFRMKTAVGGTLVTTAYCNIHGLWTAEREITLA